VIFLPVTGKSSTPVLSGPQLQGWRTFAP